MSSSRSRRGQRHAATAQPALPEVQLADIKARKWVKRLTAVGKGHFHVQQWVPLLQPEPTEALQKGEFSLVPKRKFNERARVTRSVRQHFDTPLEPAVDMIQLVKPSRVAALVYDETTTVDTAAPPLLPSPPSVSNEPPLPIVVVPPPQTEVVKDETPAKEVVEKVLSEMVEKVRQDAAQNTVSPPTSPSTCDNDEENSSSSSTSICSEEDATEEGEE